MLDEKLKQIQEQAEADFNTAKTSKELYDLKVKYLGKQGSLSLIMRDVGSLSKEERPEFGKRVNVVKAHLEKLYTSVEESLGAKELTLQIESERVDMSLPGPQINVGSKHPIQMVIDQMVSIFSKIGFSVRTGPMIELDKYNFEALNIPKDHPARDMQDTFYIDTNYVLRTQTSPIQIHSLEKETLPLRVLGPGAVFRVDADATHSPMFHQMEGMLVDKKVSMADLKGVLSFFNKEFFGSQVQTRFRPSFFPFTEPSAEVDCTCPGCSGKGCRLCSHTGWIEVGGCGLVHPNVFEQAGVSSKDWQGYAFGFGIERLAMGKYGINDIRLFSDNDTRFLEQFR
ncbi:MAG: phenylalanine--tRNA ligase subunit alpha [Bdellovibrionales bacterium]|nr:phenylalanine--tRNA ligase subunit alpha [Bdellovibrionales bacterium]